MIKTIYYGPPKPEYQCPYFDALLKRLGGEIPFVNTFTSGDLDVNPIISTYLEVWDVRGVTVICSSAFSVKGIIKQKDFNTLVTLAGSERDVLDLENRIQVEIKSSPPNAYRSVEGTPLFR